MSKLLKFSISILAIWISLGQNTFSQIDESCLCVPEEQTRTIIGYDSCEFYQLILDEVECDSMLSSQYAGFFIGNTDSTFLYGKRFASLIFNEVIFDNELSERDTILTIDDLNENVSEEILNLFINIGNQFGYFDFYVRSNTRVYLNFNEYVPIIELKKFLIKNFELLNNNDINFQLFSLEQNYTSVINNNIDKLDWITKDNYFFEVNNDLVSKINIYNINGILLNVYDTRNNNQFKITTKENLLILIGFDQNHKTIRKSFIINF